MGMVDTELKNIRGYDIDDTGKKYLNTALPYTNVRDAIITIFTLLAKKKYKVWDDGMSAICFNLNMHTFGPMLRDDIVEGLELLQSKSDVSIFFEIAQVKESHYGREMRQPLYDALVRLGAEEDFYYQTQPSDFLYSTTENGVTLIKYIGGEEYIDVLTSIDGIPVTEIGMDCFKDCKYAVVKRVRMYDGLKTIN